MKIIKAFQENNLDIGGRLIWMMAPVFDITKRDTPPFIVAESGKFFARPKFFSRREGRDGYLLLYTQAGKGLLQYKDGEYQLLPGSIALIDCNLRHEYSTYDDTDGDWTFYWLHFYCESTNFFMQIIYRDSFSVIDLGDALSPIFDAVLKILPYSDADSLLKLNESVHYILMKMIEAVGTPKTKQTKESTNVEIIKEAVEYIKANYWQPFILEDVAKHFGLSKFHFIRVFKEITGMTPYRFLIVERVNVGKKLLQTTDLRIYEISTMTGFADEGHFIRTFKTISGITPKNYRIGTLATINVNKKTR